MPVLAPTIHTVRQSGDDANAGFVRLDNRLMFNVFVHVGDIARAETPELVAIGATDNHGQLSSAMPMLRQLLVRSNLEQTQIAL